MTDKNDKLITKKSRAHIIYKLPDGTRVPGVTTILNVLAKPLLYRWHNTMGLEGIDTAKYADASAEAGKAAHRMIQCHLTGEMFDGSEYSADMLSLASNAYLKYLEWENGKTLQNIHSEMALVSEKFRVGGTIDLYCELNGKPTLVDFKTSSSGIWPEMKHQTAGGYRLLLEDNGFPVEQVLIIRTGRSEQMDFEVYEVGDWAYHADIFLKCRDIYDIQKKIR
jgi:hypothetical protein